MSNRRSTRFVTAQQLAALLEVRSERIRALFRDGKLPGYVLGKKDVRFVVEEVLDALRVPVAADVAAEEQLA